MPVFLLNPLVQAIALALTLATAATAATLNPYKYPAPRSPEIYYKVNNLTTPKTNATVNNRNPRYTTTPTNTQPKPSTPIQPKPPTPKKKLPFIAGLKPDRTPTPTPNFWDLVKIMFPKTQKLLGK